MTENNNQGGIGYSGQRGLSDDTSDYNAFAFAVRQILGSTRTVVLVKVVAVTDDGGVSAAGTVDVLPLVNQVDGVGNSTPHETVYGMPYFRVQGGAGAVVVVPAVGDIGIALIADRDISGVKKTKARANPGSRRRFNLCDGLYLGGVLNGAPTRYVLMSAAGITMADGNGNKIEMKSGSIAVTGNLTVTGAITAGFGGGDQVTLQHHLHTSGGSGSPTSAPTAGT